MTRIDGALTELEGAVLTEIHHHGNVTAFSVSRAFRASPSSEWSGSAGAVYPAIKRLTARGLIYRGEAETGRRTRRLTLTPVGLDVLEAWSNDATRATGIGLDPFRLRAGLWLLLPEPRRSRQFAAVREALLRRIAELEARADVDDELETTATRLAIELVRLRLRWLDDQTVDDAV